MTGTNTLTLGFLNTDSETDRFIEVLVKLALRGSPCGKERTEGKLTHEAGVAGTAANLPGSCRVEWVFRVAPN